MNKERAITYSLLAHIRNTGTLAKGPIDIFIPLVKRALHKMNSEGVYQGKSIIEIKKITDELYHIDFPVPVLKKILTEICKEVNSREETNFMIYQDGAFSITQYIFAEFDDILEIQKKNIYELEELFKQYCETSKFEISNSESIFKFIEKNKFNLSKYLSNNQSINGFDYTFEAQFVDFFKKIPPIYEKIKDIYLGSIIAGYIEYNTDENEQKLELLFDTNFIIGLIDLNTPESTHTCRTLLNIAKSQKFKIKVLIDTINETRNLLEKKADYFEQSFLQKKINPEDVYNACDRRKLSKSDLERIADNLEIYINEFEIDIIYHTEKLKNEAVFTKDYTTLSKVRNSKISALHDATAIHYINKVRKGKFKDFDKVNSWFVNNSTSNDGENIFLKNGIQPESIKADDLLNILWLSNPSVNKSIDANDLVEIGLTSVISLSINSNLPKSKIIRELDDNIHKYAKENITDTDIIRIASRITSKQLSDIDELNNLAETNKIEFVKRLEEEANKQKQIENDRIRKLKIIFDRLSLQKEEFEASKKEFQKKSENIDIIDNERTHNINKVSKLEYELLKKENIIREIKRNAWIKNEIRKWRINSWIELGIGLLIVLGFIIYILYNSKNVDEAISYLQDLKKDFIISTIGALLSSLFSMITISSLINKFRNHSNIKSYKESLIIPLDMREQK